MSAFTEAVRSLPRDPRDGALCNSYGFYETIGPVVWISFSSADYGRGGRGGAYFSVHRFNSHGRQVETDPEAHWHYVGQKVFRVDHISGATLKEQRAVALAEAQAWAEEKYYGDNTVAWKKDPYGSWGPADKVTARVAQLKQLVKEAA